jgi:hypothetical protein
MLVSLYSALYALQVGSVIVLARRRGRPVRYLPGLIGLAPRRTERVETLDRLASSNLSGYEALLFFLLEGIARHLTHETRRYEDDAVFVTDEDVSGLYQHTGTRNCHVSIPRDVATAEHGRARGAAKYRQPERPERADVTNTSVCDDTCCTKLLSTQGENVANSACAVLAPSPNHQYVTGMKGLNRSLLCVHTRSPICKSILSMRQETESAGRPHHLRPGTDGRQTFHDDTIESALS